MCSKGEHVPFCFFENIGVEFDPLRKQLSQNLRQLVLGIMQILHITLVVSSFSTSTRSSLNISLIRYRKSIKTLIPCSKCVIKYIHLAGCLNKKYVFLSQISKKMHDLVAYIGFLLYLCSAK